MVHAEAAGQTWRHVGRVERVTHMETMATVLMTVTNDPNVVAGVGRLALWAANL